MSNTSRLADFKSLTDIGFAGQVFRCLAGLWHIDSGQITKPGGDAVSGSLAGAVYYLPQSRNSLV